MNVHLISAPKAKVNIGSKFTGKRELHLDSRSGDYQESLPQFDQHALTLQTALLSKKKGIEWAKLVSIVAGRVKPLTDSHISPLGSVPITRSETLRPLHGVWRKQ